MNDAQRIEAVRKVLQERTNMANHISQREAKAVVDLIKELQTVDTPEKAILGLQNVNGLVQRLSCLVTSLSESVACLRTCQAIETPAYFSTKGGVFSERA